MSAEVEICCVGLVAAVVAVEAIIFGDIVAD